MVQDPVLAIIAGLVGACAGSFVATAALRSVRGEQVLSGRSHCDGCDVQLGFAATLPIISFAALRGGCGRCGGRIDPAHVVGELTAALLAGAAFWLVPPAQATLIVLLGLVLLAAAIIDQKTQRLPDPLTLVAALLAVGLATLDGRVLVGLAAATTTFVILEILRRGFVYLRGRSGLGAGDVKLLSALALWLGTGTPWALALASMAGLLVVGFARPTDGKIAFGPLIAAGAVVVGLILEARLLPAGGVFA